MITDEVKEFLSQLSLMPMRARALGLYITATKLDTAIRMSGFEAVGEVKEGEKHEQNRLNNGR